MLYLPTEEELGKEIKRERQLLETEERLAQDNKDTTFQ
jgi:hypothetical protein